MSASLPRDRRRVIAEPVGVYDAAPLGQIAQDIRQRGREAVGVLDQAATSLSREADVLRQRREQREANTGVSTFLAGTSEVNGAVDRETDPERMGTVYAEGMRALIDRVAGTISSPAAQDQFRQQAERYVASNTDGVRRLADGRSREQGQASLVSSLDTLSQSAAADPARRPEFLAQAEQMIAGAEASRTITAPEAVQQRRQFASRLDQTAALNLMNRNPGEAMRMLADQQFFPNLDPVTRERMYGTARNAVESAANRAVTAAATAEARAARQGRLLADRAASELLVRIESAREGSGEMPSIQDIARYGDWLGRDGTAALLSARRGARSENDLPTLRGLETVVTTLPPQQFEARAGADLQAGRINPETYRSLVAANRSERRDDAPSSPLTVGTRELTARLDPGTAPMSQMVRGPLEDARQNALRDLRGFLEQNPEATYGDVNQRVDALVRQYRSRSSQAARLSVGLPYGFGGDAFAVNSQTLGRAAAQLAEAIRTNAISDADRARELARIQDWQEILRMEPPPAAPAPSSSSPRGRSPAATRSTP